MFQVHFQASVQLTVSHKSWQIVARTSKGLTSLKQQRRATDRHSTAVISLIQMYRTDLAHMAVPLSKFSRMSAVYLL